MIRSHALRSLATASAAGLALVAASSQASAQASLLPDSIPVGAWTLRPLVEVRVRGEYRRHPFDVGGDTYGDSAIFAQDTSSPLPKLTGTDPEIKNLYFAAERARLGLAVDRGP